VIKNSDKPHRIVEFSPYGYDERQFCSPGFNLAVGCFSRSQHGTFPEYHTSADNLDFVRPDALGESYATCMSVISLLEKNRVYLSLFPKCEPQLGKRGLYRTMGGYSNAREVEMAMLWVLNLSDGTNSLLDIADRSGLEFPLLENACQLLVKNGLLAVQ
jgi:aminopeptidase-like protein